jgi:hypothetical protein
MSSLPTQALRARPTLPGHVGYLRADKLADIFGEQGMFPLRKR